MESLKSQNWSFKENKVLFISGALALGSILAYSSSWLLSKLKKASISPWLEEYLQESKEMYKELKGKKTLPVNFIAFNMNLITELQQHLFTQENSELENERMKNIGNEQAYEELVGETIEVHERYYQAASNIIKSKTGINMDDVRAMLGSVDQREMKEAMNTERRLYNESELPSVSKEKLRESYIIYAKTFTQHARIAADQMVLMQKRPEYQEIAFKTIFQNKFLLKDLIKSKYGFDTKYFEQLIKKHNLLEDSEIAYYYEDVKRSYNP